MSHSESFDWSFQRTYVLLIYLLNHVLKILHKFNGMRRKELAKNPEELAPCKISHICHCAFNDLKQFSLYLLRKGYTVKFFFQGISWNTVSGSFHETWNNFMKYFYFSIQHSEAAVQVCSVKKVFLESAQNSQENTCTRVSF